MPKLDNISLDMEPPPFHMRTLQLHILQIGVQSPLNDNNNINNNKNKKNNNNNNKNNSSNASSLSYSARHGKQPSAPMVSRNTNSTASQFKSNNSANTGLISNKDMKALVNTMFGTHGGNDSNRSKLAEKYQAPEAVEPIAELTSEEMQSYGFFR